MPSLHEILMRGHARAVLSQYHQTEILLRQNGGAATVPIMAILGPFGGAQDSDSSGVRMVEQGTLEVVATDGLSIGIQDVIEIETRLYNVIDAGQPRNGFIALVVQRLLTHEMSRNARGGR